MKLAWGKKVSEQFRKRITEICIELGIQPDYLMSCMAFESGETFSPSVVNAAGSGATGLIQFMPRTARMMGTTTEELAKLTAEQQLEYVRLYFLPQKNRLKTLEDVYMSILYPLAIGKPLDYVLFYKVVNDKETLAYIQNRGLDWNADGAITKKEAAAGVQRKYDKGLTPEFFFNDEPIMTSDKPLSVA